MADDAYETVYLLLLDALTHPEPQGRGKAIRAIIDMGAPALPILTQIKDKGANAEMRKLIADLYRRTSQEARQRGHHDEAPNAGIEEEQRRRRDEQARRDFF